MASVDVGRIELRWMGRRTYRYNKPTRSVMVGLRPLFARSWAAGGWLRCWHIFGLRIAWRCRVQNKAAWDAQPSMTLARAAELARSQKEEFSE